MGCKRVASILDLIGANLLEKIIEIESNTRSTQTQACKTLVFWPPEKKPKIMEKELYWGVQGVSFRDFCRNLMEAIGNLEGTAENQTNRSVIVQIEGPGPKVQLFKDVLTPNQSNPFIQEHGQRFPGARYVYIDRVEEK